jgi:hypothetical protein
MVRFAGYNTPQPGNNPAGNHSAAYDGGVSSPLAPKWNQG